MKVVYKNENGDETVLAESDKTLMIEGNQYFPADSVKMEHFEKTDFSTVCHWKGDASYYSIKVGDTLLENAAWYYPNPKEGSPERVAAANNGNGDFANYVAFYLRDGVELRS